MQTLAEVLFKELGAGLQLIGLTALFHLPWNLKFLWGPWLDEYATKRRWLIATEIAISATLFALALIVSSHVALAVVSGVFVVLAFLSATHDIAIDGFYLEALDRSEQAKFVGYRAPAYRVAMLAVSGPMVIIVPRIGWALTFAVAGFVMIALLVYHAIYLPDVEKRGAPIQELLRRIAKSRTLAVALLLVVLAGVAAYFSDLSDRARALRGWAERQAPDLVGSLSRVSLSEWIGLGLLAFLVVGLVFLARLRAVLRSRESPYAWAFVAFLSQPQVGRILAFIVLFRAGESFLMKMRYPFFRDIGMSMADYGLAGGTIGMIAALAAPAVGGYLIGKQGLRRWIWPFVLAQNLLHFLYVALAYAHDVRGEGAPPFSFALLTTVITVENFGAGLGTAVFMVYIMRCCHPSHRAAHMAILTALMSTSFTLAGTVSGFLAEWLGYTAYFAFTVVATIPSMVLIGFIPHIDDRDGAKERT